MKQFIGIMFFLYAGWCYWQGLNTPIPGIDYKISGGVPIEDFFIYHFFKAIFFAFVGGMIYASQTPGGFDKRVPESGTGDPRLKDSDPDL